MPIKVIDLFAGPGGLGEGFAAFQNGGEQAFKIAISIEKEASAHRTLELRALFRQFTHDKVPDEYYAFLRGELGSQPEEKLYRIPEIQQELENAKTEAQQITLGETDQETVFSKISDALGGDQCVLIGGPPCQAYSLVGRSRNYGAKDKNYSPDEDHRNFLYREYLEIIAKFQPQVFVMENVKGMLSARVGPGLIFEAMRKDLEDPLRVATARPERGRGKHKYIIRSFVKNPGSANFSGFDVTPDPHDFIIRSEKYGVPQARHRVILLGIREDIAQGLEKIPELDESDRSVATVEQVISDLPKLRSRLSKSADSVEDWRDAISRFRSDGFNLIKNDSNVPAEVYANLEVQLENMDSSPSSVGKNWRMKRRAFHKKLPEDLKNWYRDDRLNSYIVNHESRGHIPEDLHRYLYYSTYAAIVKSSPTLTNLPPALLPNHGNRESGKFVDRFRVQRADAPGTTVTCHISKDGHYYIHYDANQCRSLTVREAARIQTFPDNYYFVGNRTQQYVQVGNAVPPFLAKQIAAIVSQILDR